MNSIDADDAVEWYVIVRLDDHKGIGVYHMQLNNVEDILMHMIDQSNTDCLEHNFGYIVSRADFEIWPHEKYRLLVGRMI